MGKLARNKALAGNISLVVFLAFLFTVTFGMALAPQDAYAAGYTYKTDEPVPANIVGTGTYTTTAEGIAVKLTPLSGEDFNVIDLYLSTTDSVDGKIGKMVYQGVYNNVYTWTYTWQTVYDQIYLLVYKNGAVYESVLLDVRDPVPDGGGGGGGGGGGQQPGTTTTTTGTGTVTSTDTSATLKVDAVAVETAIANSAVTEVNIVIPENLARDENTLVVPAATLQKAFEAGKPVVAAAAGVEIRLPAQAVNLEAMARDGATVSIVINRVDPARVEGTGTFKVLGSVFRIEIQVARDGQAKGKIESFSKPVMLAIPYAGVDLKGVPEDRLSVSRYNEAAGRWDNLGGTVDRQNKVVTVSRDSLSLYALAERPLKTFADIAGHWAKADIELMADRGIVKGVSDTAFAPDRMITRAEFATLVVRSLNLADDKAAAAKFKDVSAADWFAGTVGAAAKAGLVAGYGDGTFRPGNSITREEMAAIIVKAISAGGLTGPQVDEQLSAFKDAGMISSWAREAVAGAVKAGIVRGRTDGNFDPKANATRAEGVVMLKNMLTTMGKL